MVSPVPAQRYPIFTDAMLTHPVAEYLRAKYVEVPVKFLERGRI